MIISFDLSGSLRHLLEHRIREASKRNTKIELESSAFDGFFLLLLDVILEEYQLIVVDELRDKSFFNEVPMSAFHTEYSLNMQVVAEPINNFLMSRGYTVGIKSNVMFHKMNSLIAPDSRVLVRITIDRTYLPAYNVASIIDRATAKFLQKFISPLNIVLPLSLLGLFFRHQKKITGEFLQKQSIVAHSIYADCYRSYSFSGQIVSHEIKSKEECDTVIDNFIIKNPRVSDAQIKHIIYSFIQGGNPIDYLVVAIQSALQQFQKYILKKKDKLQLMPVNNFLWRNGKLFCESSYHANLRHSECDQIYQDDAVDKPMLVIKLQTHIPLLASEHYDFSMPMITYDPRVAHIVQQLTRDLSNRLMELKALADFGNLHYRSLEGYSEHTETACAAF